MSSWPLVRLGDCAEIVSGSTPKTSVGDYWDGDVHWATPKDLSDLDGHLIAGTARTLTAAGLRSCGASVLPAGSVLFSSRAPIGLVAVNTVPMATNQGFKSFIPRPDLLHTGYLAHWLRTNRKRLDGLGNGATFKEVSKAVVARVEIPLPPVPEQRRIAEVLDRADALRAKRGDSIALYDAVLRSIFLDMFGDPCTNTRGWPTSPIKSLGRVTTGNTPPREVASYYGTDLEWIKSDNLGRGTCVSRAEESLSREGAALARIVGAGAVLVTCIAGSPTSIGNAAIANRPVAFNQQINAIEPFDMESQFLLVQLKVGKRLVQAASSGGMKGMVSKSRFEGIRLISPPLGLQTQFTQRVSLLEEVRQSSLAQSAAVNALFASLQSRAFGGVL